MIADYPEFSPLTLTQRPILHPLFQQLAEGISEFSFANLYLFRETHNYQVSRLFDDIFVFAGHDTGNPFFMLPFGLVEQELLLELFHNFKTMKCVSEQHAVLLQQKGFTVREDRINFDYVYTRKDLAQLYGRKFHKKRTLVNAFLNNCAYEGRPLLEEYASDALRILESWRQGHDDPGDYVAAKEALEKMDELQLCGGIYYVDGRPAAYSLGEELARGTSFVIHFEKAASDCKGIWQFVNQAFASILPEKYQTINREQDLGDEGLRHAKLSYNPISFVKKYRASRESDTK
jgi:uncharacterized protein